MDISLLIELVNSLGLPSVIIGCSFWYINRKDQMHAAEIDSWRNKDDTSDERLIGLINSTNTRNEEFKVALGDQTAAIRELVVEMRGSRK